MEEVVVPQQVVDLAADHYSVTEFERGRIKTFVWAGKRWTCIGGLSRHLRYAYVDICEVVPPLYLSNQDVFAPPYPNRYVGRRFRENHSVWLITNHQARLVAAQQAKPADTAEQLLLWEGL